MSRAVTIGPIVVVEPWAHRASGHFPNRFAELADAFAALGHPVAVVTTAGWHGPTSRPVNWTVHTYRPSTLRAVALAAKTALRWGTRWPRLNSLPHLVACLAEVTEARRVARALEQEHPGTVAGLVTLSYHLPPILLDLVAGSRPWIQHVFDEGRPFASARPLARVAGRWRTARGRARSRVALALPGSQWVHPLHERARNPYPALLRLAGTRAVVGGTEDLRRILGLRRDLRIALHFGALSADRRPVTVAKAFASRHDWQLLMVGEVAAVLDDPALSGTPWAVPPVALPGNVTDTVRSLAFRAADVVVLSFRSGFDRNSGTLMDALSYRKPILVSNPSYAADLVSEYRIGALYDSENEASLSMALDQLDLAACTEPLAAARARLSNRAIAAAHVELLADLANQREESLRRWATTPRP